MENKKKILWGGEKRKFQQGLVGFGKKKIFNNTQKGGVGGCGFKTRWVGGREKKKGPGGGGGSIKTTFLGKKAPGKSKLG